MRLAVHLDGRTARRFGDRVRRRRSARAGRPRVADAVRVAPARPGLARPGRAPAPPTRRTVGRPGRPAARRPADRAQVVRGVRRRRRRAGDGRLLPHQPLDRRASPTPPVSRRPARRSSAACPGIARDDGADGVARHAPLRLGRARRAARSERGRRRRRAPGPSPSSCRPGATRSCSSRRRSPTSWRRSPSPGSTARPSTSDGHSCASARRQFDPAISLVDDPLAVGFGVRRRGNAATRLTLVDVGHGAVAHPRPPQRGRGRVPTSTGPRRSESGARGGRSPAT